MKVIKCKKCGYSVPESKEKCPKCGTQILKESNMVSKAESEKDASFLYNEKYKVIGRKIIWQITIVIIVIIIDAFLFIMMYNNPNVVKFIKALWEFVKAFFEGLCNS